MNLSFASPFGSERSALDLPVAALAGLAVAFAMFTIPDELLGQGVAATGIANFISAAQPPLGMTARALLGIVGGIAAFSGAFLLLRWLDRFALRAPAPVPAPAAPEAPRIRKSDAHPDAPPCRPISASRDLGEPAPPSQPAARAATETATEITKEAPAAPVSTESLGALMARLERGLARREQAAAPASATEAERPMEVSPPAPSNDRLQSAIEGLRALSTRG